MNCSLNYRLKEREIKLENLVLDYLNNKIKHKVIAYLSSIVLIRSWAVKSSQIL